MFKRLLVGTDGSDTASKAVEHAAELARRLGAELVVVHAYPSPTQVSGSPLGREPYPYQEIGKSILEDAAKRFGSGVRLRAEMREGPAEDVLIDVAADEAADVIVVGNKGMAGGKRFLLGSVPNHVSHHAPCAVLIVQTT